MGMDLGVLATCFLTKFHLYCINEETFIISHYSNPKTGMEGKHYGR